MSLSWYWHSWKREACYIYGRLTADYTVTLSFLHLRGFILTIQNDFKLQQLTARYLNWKIFVLNFVKSINRGDLRVLKFVNFPKVDKLQTNFRLFSPAKMGSFKKKCINVKINFRLLNICCKFCYIKWLNDWLSRI